MMKRRLALTCAAAALVAGCNPVAGVVGLIDGIARLLNPPRAPGLLEGKRVVVLPFAPLRVRVAHPDLEREAAACLLVDLRQVFPKTSFVSLEALQQWQTQHPDWRGMFTPAIGKALDADLVLEVNIPAFRTRDRPGGMVLQGEVTWEARLVEVATEKRLWKMGRSRVRWPRTPRHFIDDVPEEHIRGKVIAEFTRRLVSRLAVELQD